MTPAEHLTRAEHLLEVAEQADDRTAGVWVQVNIQAATTHALIALGAQLGVPHQHMASGGGDTGGT